MVGPGPVPKTAELQSALADFGEQAHRLITDDWTLERDVADEVHAGRGDLLDPDSHRKLTR